MDMTNPTQVESVAGKKYIYVIVDDYSRFTWVFFIREKYETFEVFKKLCLKLQKEKGHSIVKIVQLR